MNKLPTSFVINTKRCRLRYPLASDAPHIWSASRVQGFNDGMVWDPPQTQAELTEPLNRAEAAWQQGSSFTFSAESTNNDAPDSNEHKFIGRIATRETDNKGVWDIGYWIHPDHQNQGYATEIAQAIVDFSFNTLNAKRVEAAYAKWNHHSGRVLDNIGMQRVGATDRGFLKNNKWVAEWLMAIDVSDLNR